MAALEDDNGIQDTDPNLGDVDAILAPIKIYRCWNCDGGSWLGFVSGKSQSFLLWLRSKEHLQAAMPQLFGKESGKSEGTIRELDTNGPEATLNTNLPDLPADDQS